MSMAPILRDEYLELCSAIIKQAVNDYKYAARIKTKLSKKPELTKEEKERLASAINRIDEVKRFFKSEWAKTLCGEVDPLYILTRIEKKYKTLENVGTVQRKAVI